jgi:hypothetical protein
MAVGPFIRKTDLVDLVRAQDINELQIACEDLQSQLGTFSAYGRLQTEGKIGWANARLPLGQHSRYEFFLVSITEANDFITGLPSGWTWAGSPFVAPTWNIVGNSWLRVLPGAGNRSFLVAPGTPTRSTRSLRNVWVHFSPGSSGRSYFGVRWDDGSDSNYLESVVRAHGTDFALLELIYRLRVGGGSVTETVLGTFSKQLIMQWTLWTSASDWSSWSWMNDLYNPIFFMSVATGTATFTPTRVGLVFYTVEAWNAVYVDGLAGTWP